MKHFTVTTVLTAGDQHTDTTLRSTLHDALIALAAASGLKVTSLTFHETETPVTAHPVAFSR